MGSLSKSGGKQNGSGDHNYKAVTGYRRGGGTGGATAELDITPEGSKIRGKQLRFNQPHPAGPDPFPKDHYK